MNKKYPNSLFRDHEARIILLNKNIQQLIKKITQAASKKNQANWHAYGGKNSRYFFSLENKFPKKPITRMKVGGKNTSDGEEILGELEKYYKNLFSMKLQELITDNDFLKGLELPQITVEDYKILEELISLEEVEIAIEQLKRNKTPGLDGIGIEFYQEMLNEIKYLVHSLILEIVETQELNKSACQGLISLLDKPGKDQLIIANWRPLSLLCCDYKIFAKILANRLSMVTKYLIHPDQSGFLKGQFISENLMDLNAVLTITELEQIPASLISIDFQRQTIMYNGPLYMKSLANSEWART